MICIKDHIEAIISGNLRDGKLEIKRENCRSDKYTKLKNSLHKID